MRKTSKLGQIHDMKRQNDKGTHNRSVNCKHVTKTESQADKASGDAVASAVGRARAHRYLHSGSAMSDGVVVHFATRSRALGSFAVACLLAQRKATLIEKVHTQGLVPLIKGIKKTVFSLQTTCQIYLHDS